MRKILVVYLLAIFTVFSTAACTPKERPIKRGEACAHCKMPVSDLKFAAELVTKKGKIFVFDDLICAIKYIQTTQVDKSNIHNIFATNFYNENQLLNVNKAFFLKSESFRSPMNGNIGTFTSDADLQKAAKQFKGNNTTWNELIK